VRPAITRIASTVARRAVASPGVAVRLATEADVSRLAPVLAAAFAGDPPMAHLVPGRRREERLRPYFEAIIPAIHMPRGEVWMSDDPVGAAAWVAPGRWPLAPGENRPVLGTLTRTFGRHPVRALAGVHRIERGHPTEPHWYLDYIGVAPAAHGRGIGTALLAPVLERCDRERVPAYLNAGSPRSRDLYRRHGFEVTEEFSLPFGGPPLWRMWRTPR
jgi:GNAT superfamily N-acetyltransferase